jgi:hypothetical protein
MAFQAPNRTSVPHRERGSGILIGFFMRSSFLAPQDINGPQGLAAGVTAFLETLPAFDQD